jgi:hypothetical protein
MQKFRPPLSPPELAQLKALAALDFSNYNETDIRENFIRPLLTLLGYEKDRDYSADTEKSFTLSAPFLRIGRDRIKLDYLNAVRKQNFWLIEAKDGSGGKDGSILDEDVCQAYFYALHQSVNCRYFAVCNGWFFNLYDRETLDARLNPLLTIRNSDLPVRFLEIDAMIGSTQVQAHIKSRLIGETERVLSAEVSLERLEEFVEAVKGAARRAWPKALENFRVNYRREESDREQAYAEILQQERADQIVDTFFMTSSTHGSIRKVSEALVEKVIATSGGDHFLLFDRILLNTLRPVTHNYYINSIHFLLRLVDRGVEHVDYFEKGSRVPVRELLHRYLWWVLTRFEDRQDLRVLTLFEGMYTRAFKRMFILLRAQRSSIEQSVAFERFVLPEERVAAAALCPAGVLLDLVQGATMRACGEMVARFYDDKKRYFKAALAEQELQSLTAVSQPFLQFTETDYVRIRGELGTDWSETQFLDSLFSGWDRVLAATMEYLTPREHTVRQLPSKIKKQISYVLSLGVAGGLGDGFAKKYAVKTPQFPEPGKLIAEFFDTGYKSNPEAFDDF